MSNRCAACKFLRRKCLADCIFSPYFPGDNPQRFASVHKIYGASNVGKMLQQVPVHNRAETAETLFIEAENRIKNSVYGSAGIITMLHQELSDKNAELARVQAELVAYKTQNYYSQLAGSAEINSYNAQVHSQIEVGPFEQQQQQQLGPEVHSHLVVGLYHQQQQQQLGPDAHKQFGVSPFHHQQQLGLVPDFVSTSPFHLQQQQLGPIQQQSELVNAFLLARDEGFGSTSSNN